MRYDGTVPARLANTAATVAFMTPLPYRMSSVASLTPKATPEVVAYRAKRAILVRRSDDIRAPIERLRNESTRPRRDEPRRGSVEST
jgi:hypothetical protein